MAHQPFTESDIRRLKNHGLTAEIVKGQLSRFVSGVRQPRLLAPCRVDKGIAVLSSKERTRLADFFQQAVDKGRLTKFIPASGAATRMFQFLLFYLHSREPLDREALAAQEEKGGKEAGQMLRFLDHLKAFPFYENLARVLEKANLHCETLLERGEIRPVLDYLLTNRGLGYAALPKGLIPFHCYSDPAAAESLSRTSLEEHLAEAGECFRDRNGECRLHFTVSAEHHTAVREHLEQACARSQVPERTTRFVISFSEQKPFTDTIAVDEANRPFRDENGQLVFRPGGHGALLENLNDLDGDIVFIKNVDNIAKRSLRLATMAEIQALGGLLVELQNTIYAYLQGLSAGTIEDVQMREALDFVAGRLNRSVPEEIAGGSKEVKRNFLFSTLNRPLRVCGVVKHAGEPGGGPFYVQDPDGGTSVQIIEAAQVDRNDPEQKRIWASSTHFNPVIIACGVKDFQGRRFFLPDFADPEAGIITEKSRNGRPLKALEHPGLWNGGMAFWNTVFVELSPFTFNPVKTVLDLLRAGHQPEE